MRARGVRHENPLPLALSALATALLGLAVLAVGTKVVLGRLRRKGHNLRLVAVVGDSPEELQVRQRERDEQRPARGVGGPVGGVLHPWRRA